MLKKDMLTQYIKNSNHRLKKVKYGECISTILKNQQVPDTQNLTTSPTYKPLTEILLSPKLISSKAMQEYRLGRSFSESLERKKHSNLVSFFAEKYKFISYKIGEKFEAKAENRTFRSKSIAVAQCAVTPCKKKSKIDLLCERFKEIDQGVIKMIEPKSFKVKLSKEQYNRKNLIIRAKNRIRC